MHGLGCICGRMRRKKGGKVFAEYLVDSEESQSEEF